MLETATRGNNTDNSSSSSNSSDNDNSSNSSNTQSHTQPLREPTLPPPMTTTRSTKGMYCSWLVTSTRVVPAMPSLKQWWNTSDPTWASRALKGSG